MIDRVFRAVLEPNLEVGAGTGNRLIPRKIIAILTCPLVHARMEAVYTVSVRGIGDVERQVWLFVGPQGSEPALPEHLALPAVRPVWLLASP